VTDRRFLTLPDELARIPLSLFSRGGSMRTVPFSDARANLQGVLDQIVDDVDVTLITRRDAPNAIVMPQAYYDSLMETLHLLQSPANVAHLKRSITQVKAS
jgi:antitoxin YefM